MSFLDLFLYAPGILIVIYVICCPKEEKFYNDFWHSADMSIDFLLITDVFIKKKKKEI